MKWEDFFTNYNIEYVEYGPNVKQGNININCPWCDDDPSHHMGIALDKDAYGCWRNMEHKGTSPAKLVRALLGCSYTQAKLIVSQYSTSDPDTLDDALASLTGTEGAANEASQPDKLHMPTEFKQIRRKGTTSRFWRYLKARGFNDIKDVTSYYRIKCCSIGIWQDRIIFPVYHNRKLVTWTGRSLQDPISAPRYKTHSREHGALMSIKDTVYNYDNLKNEPRRILYITEGPIDALKIDWFGFEHGARATCLFGAQLKINQASLIVELKDYYEKIVLLFDQEADEQKYQVIDMLGSYGVENYDLPEGIGDPGKMTPKQIKELINLA